MEEGQEKYYSGRETMREAQMGTGNQAKWCIQSETCRLWLQPSTRSGLHGSIQPVCNDVTFRLVIVLMIALKLDALIFDVTTAFLTGDLEEELYMECPEGMCWTYEYNTKRCY